MADFHQSEHASTSTARPTRVLMVSRLFHPWVGGMERQALKLARALAEDGVEVRIATGRWFKGTPRREHIDGIEVFRNHTLWEGFGVRGLRRIGGYLYMVTLAWHLWLTRKTYDLIHVHGLSYHTYVARLVGSRLGKPVIVKLANSGGASDITKLRTGQHLAGTGWMLPGALRCDRVVALNPTIADELRAESVDERRITHIPNGVEMPIVDRIYVDRPEIRLLYLGRLHPQKDLSTLLEAVALVVAGGDNVTLEVVGDGPDRHRLETEVADRRLAGHLRFEGERPDPETALAGADVLVLPSLAEGLSNSLLEAMASGLPVVVSAIPGNLLVVENGRTGLTFPPGDAEALAGTIRRMIRDPGLRKELATNARDEIAARFSIRAVAQQYRHLYTTLLEENR
jgi:L-malate glycosyltransferase